METSSLPRPRQVTLAAWLIMGGSVFVVATVFERIAGLHSLETQRSVQRFLSEPPGDGLGVGLEQMLDVIRIVSMVAAACAAAAGVLGFHVLKRNRSARLALAFLVLPLFLTGLVAGGFMSSIVAAAAVMLWFQPARDWFDGVPASASSASRPAAGPWSSTGGPRSDPSRSDTSHPPTADRTEPPPAHEPYGAAPSVGTLLDGPGRHLEDRPPRPGALISACVLTLVGASLILLLSVAILVVMATSPEAMFEEIRKNPELSAEKISQAELVATMRAVSGVLIVWALGAIVLVVLALRGVAWARVGLVVSATTTAVLCLMATLGQQFFMVLPLAAAVTALTQLVRPEVRDWFVRGRGPRG